MAAISVLKNWRMLPFASLDGGDPRWEGLGGYAPPYSDGNHVHFFWVQSRVKISKWDISIGLVHIAKVWLKKVTGSKTACTFFSLSFGFLKTIPTCAPLGASSLPARQCLPLSPA